MSLTHLDLSSGRTVDLVTLRMTGTYGGVLEGYPSRRLNDLQVSGLLRAAEREYPGTPVHLVTPPRAYPEGDRSLGPFGPVEVLPAVRCLGFFRAGPVDPDADPVLRCSELVVAWFQAEPSVPSGDRAERGLADLRWDELARDRDVQPTAPIGLTAPTGLAGSTGLAGPPG